MIEESEKLMKEIEQIKVQRNVLTNAVNHALSKALKGSSSPT